MSALVCSKCSRPLYHDMTASKGYGSSKIPLRDEIDESTFCPEGGQHEGGIAR